MEKEKIYNCDQIKGIENKFLFNLDYIKKGLI